MAYYLFGYYSIFFTSSMRSLFTGNLSFLGGPFFIPVQSNNSKKQDIFQFVKYAKASQSTQN